MPPYSCLFLPPFIWCFDFYIIVDPLYRSISQKHDSTTPLQPIQSAPTKSLVDPSNSDRPKRLKKSDNSEVDGDSPGDVILIDIENRYVPDSISPSPVPGMRRFSFHWVWAFF